MPAFGHFAHFQQLLETVGQFWSLLAFFDHFCPLLAFLLTLAHARPVSGDFWPLFVTFALFAHSWALLVNFMQRPPHFAHSKTASVAVWSLLPLLPSFGHFWLMVIPDVLLTASYCFCPLLTDVALLPNFSHMTQFSSTFWPLWPLSSSSPLDLHLPCFCHQSERKGRNGKSGQRWPKKWTKVAAGEQIWPKWPKATKGNVGKNEQKWAKVGNGGQKWWGKSPMDLFSDGDARIQCHKIELLQAGEDLAHHFHGRNQPTKGTVGPGQPWSAQPCQNADLQGS